MALIPGNVIRGTDESEAIDGTTGDDLIFVLGGSDTIDGGLGFDAILYTDNTSAITVNFALGTVTDAAGTDTFKNIEMAFGTDFADSFVGGLSGESWFQGGGGNDTLRGGAGFDWADYYDEKRGGVSVDLMTGRSSGKTTGKDRLEDIDNIRGSRNDDKLSGNDLGNRIRGMEGDDIINGRGGSDVADYRNAEGRVVIDLQKGKSSGADGKDTLISIESARGSDFFGDKITGSNGANYLSGLGGNDTINGGKGNDWIDGGRGTDKLTGGKGADIFVWNNAIESETGSSKRDTVLDFVSGTDKLGLYFDANTTLAGRNDFSFVGSADFSGTAGELRSVIVGSDTIVTADINGDSIADFEVVLRGKFDLAAGDFVFV